MTQAQREALLDLLHLAILADSHLSLKEEEVLETAIGAIGWDSPKPREIHMLNSISRARQATDSEQATAAFISARAAVFTSPAEQQEAISALQTVLASDGLAPAESAFLAQLTAAFS